ncbi:Alpha-(1,3)-fucosyltransferase C [Eumeta japonica]|uniref:Fucosyltransferase n=1 Tax=Eumeta variegata TaxID=151549 RepID=A0A4C1YHJ0_EUMVA|nr:Alpha-(1,3)-fucosyltransferase C [Eumeta japonica]
MVRLALHKMHQKLAVRPILFLCFVVSLVTTTLFYFSTVVSTSPQELVRAALEECARDSRYAEVYRRPDRLPPGYKYLLLWSPPDIEPIVGLGSSQRAFLDHNCSVVNCYVTTDRNLLGGDLTRFDAILFDGRHVAKMKRKHLPPVRHPRQLYIYFNSESADNYPVCDECFDDFFNMTVTYRLDSDVPWLYFAVQDALGHVVGPQANMRWAQPARIISSPLLDRLARKTRAAAWFVSNCWSRSGREHLVNYLQKALVPYKLQVDVFGQCGRLKCSRTVDTFCDKLIERDYYFYLALENSFAEDYVTEKVWRAVNNTAVPVVLGGAQYDRFLPPGSYLDAGQLSVAELAKRIAHAVRSPTYYSRFFRWRELYSWTNKLLEKNVCAVCAALHAPRMSTARYGHFRRWWHPEYEERCGIKDLSPSLL